MGCYIDKFSLYLSACCNFSFISCDCQTSSKKDLKASTVGLLFEYIAKPRAFENESASGSLNSALYNVSSFTTKTFVARLVVVFKIPIFGASSYNRLTIWALLSLMEQIILISRASLFLEACIR